MTNEHNLEENEGPHSPHPLPSCAIGSRRRSLYCRKFQGQHLGKRQVSVVDKQACHIRKGEGVCSPHQCLTGPSGRVP